VLCSLNHHHLVTVYCARHEAKAAAELSHPNIATIHGTGEIDGKPFLVLEYLEGQTLKEHCAQGPLPIDDVLRIGQAWELRSRVG